MEVQAIFIISVCTISVAALLLSVFATRKSTAVEERVERKSKRLDKLEESVKRLAEEMKNG